jgi:hypothetical protein
MAIDQAGLDATIAEALAPHGLLRRERTPGEDGIVTREGWSAFLFPSLGEASLMWATPEDAALAQEGRTSRDLDDIAMRLDKVNRMAEILNGAGFLGETEMTPNGTPAYRITRIPA